MSSLVPIAAQVLTLATATADLRPWQVPVNAVLGDASFVAAFGRAPDAGLTCSGSWDRRRPRGAPR